MIKLYDARTRLLAFALVLVPALPAQKKPPEPQAPTSTGNYALDEAIARYKQVMPRRVFRYHTDGRMRLAATGQPQALEILASDYQKVKDYAEYSRYTIATLIGRHFKSGTTLAALEALCAANNKPGDMWLWIQVLRTKVDLGGEAEVQELATTHKNPLIRAAAILALGESRNANVKSVLVSTCAEFPKRDWERSLLVGAMSGAIAANKARVNDKEFRDGLRAYASLLAPEVDLSHTLKVQMARHLMTLLKAPALFVDPESWYRILDSGDVKKTSDDRTSSAPRFCGIETDGERFCYVIDMSDSMCIKIEPSAKPEGPTTGPKQKKPKGVLPDESDLPWHKIVTRWDLAREQLKISLMRLSDDKHFSVVWFGTESGTLESTKGMVRATKANVDRVIKELDTIQPAFKNIDLVKSPDGALRGSTNMHSGLRRAFGLTNKGFVDSLAYVDPEALISGCDTIFLLSDGKPSWDDFHIIDRDYGEGKVVVDTEYGAAAARTPNIKYHGPFDQPDWLVEDVKRMNVFRRIRLHCIGLGEADMQLLGQLAEIGNGEVISVGRGK